MKPRYGLQKEDKMVNALNNKKIGDLNANLKKMMANLYGIIEDDEIVKCRKKEDFSKPDLVITYKGVSRYISMKSGTAKEIHEEQISTVISFLHRLGISKYTLNTLLLFQYGDDTTNGTGDHRMTWQEVYKKYDQRIKYANNELNRNKKVFLDIMERCMFQGVDVKAIPADALYHGDENSGVLVTKNQFLKYFQMKNWDLYNSFHIGPMILRPHSRDVNHDIQNEHLRHKLQFNWPTLKADMLYINEHFSSYIRVGVL